MNRIKFREEMIKIIYADVVNPDQDLSLYEPEIIEEFKSFKKALEVIDDIIKANLVNWSIGRLNYVDLAIIRYAVYELQYLDLPKEIVMNEALELTKKFTNLDDDQARKFNNRLLQNIVDGISDKDA
ncbi:MAG TPA: transcription antitermination factor NusB [Candidatus Izemoplasmatales bacterium]|nr:transcription antitermination factor NusB [Candidatus Izemoplasmatales bacterium]